MTQVMRRHVYISNVVKVGFVLHVYVDACHFPAIATFVLLELAITQIHREQ